VNRKTQCPVTAICNCLPKSDINPPVRKGRIGNEKRPRVRRSTRLRSRRPMEAYRPPQASRNGSGNRERRLWSNLGTREELEDRESPIYGERSSPHSDIAHTWRASRPRRARGRGWDNQPTGSQEGATRGTWARTGGMSGQHVISRYRARPVAGCASAMLAARGTGPRASWSARLPARQACRDRAWPTSRTTVVMMYIRTCVGSTPLVCIPVPATSASLGVRRSRPNLLSSPSPAPIKRDSEDRRAVSANAQST
jgi:hypothetical protein